MKAKPTSVTVGSESQVEELVARLADEFIGRMERDEDPSIEEYANRHPEVAPLIRRSLQALKTMRSVEFWEGESAGDDEPRTIGDFRLIRVLGRGGMGIVYEAEQMSLRRRVALKVLPYAAMLDERALQRFRNEVTAAAQLDHPHIVPVHGVGCERGVHHYAMRLIEGVSLAEVIDQLRDLRESGRTFPDSIASMSSSAASDAPAGEASDSRNGERARDPATSHRDTSVARKTTAGSSSWKQVRPPVSHFRSVAVLAATVAEALDHAHHHGIVHRDVKPSNVMLDVTGKPWVTDFGLAQVETGTAMTMTGDVLGTARYMSPEQVLARRVILDHRTDIYSLGVTLYEMLALELPFFGEDRRELFRQIAFEEPKSLRQINPWIPVDLATIVLQAMEKNPDDRYQSAQELAEDLRRFAQNESIVARPPSVLKRASRWITRHAALSWSAAVILLVITITSSVAVVVVGNSLGKERAARERADDLYTSNEALSQQAKEAIDQYIAAIENDAMLQDPNAAELRNELLGHARRYYSALVSQLRASDSKLELAEAMLKLEELMSESASLEESLAVADEVIALLSERHVSHSESAARYRLLSKAYHRRAILEFRIGHIGACHRAFETAVIHARRAYNAEPTDATNRETLCVMLGSAHELRIDNAAEYLQEAIDLRRAFLETDPDDADWQAGLARALLQLGWTAEDLDAKAAAFDEASEILERLTSRHPDNVAVLSLAGECASAQGERYEWTDEWDLGQQAREEAVRHYERLTELRPHQWMFRNQLGIALINLGVTVACRGNIAGAQQYFDAAITVLEGVSGDHPEMAGARLKLADALMHAGGVLAYEGDLTSARELFHRSLSLSHELIERDPDRVESRNMAIITWTMLVLIALEEGDAVAAETAVSSALELFPRFDAGGPDNRQTRWLLARVHGQSARLAFNRGGFESARDSWETALGHMLILAEIRRNTEDDVRIAIYAGGLLVCLMNLEDYEVAKHIQSQLIEDYSSCEMHAMGAGVFARLADLNESGRGDSSTTDRLREQSTQAADRALELLPEMDGMLHISAIAERLCRWQLPAPDAERVHQEFRELFGQDDPMAVQAQLYTSLRAGRPGECVEMLMKIENLSTASCAVGAMAYWQLGQHEEAREWLSTAEESIEGHTYVDRETRHWLDEARELIER